MSAASRSEAEPREPLQRDAGRGKLVFFDAFSGIAGDMLVAALVDLGVPREVIQEALDALPLDGYELRFSHLVRSGIRATKFDVFIQPGGRSRDYAAIRAMLEECGGLREGTRQLALDAFGRLAEAEARVHGTTVDAVHFHEVGAIDSIVDIVASAALLDHLGAEVVSAPLPMGRGFIRSQHGRIPGPAPATLECLANIPTYDAGTDHELVTPTGACLVAAASRGFCRWPDVRPERCGWGAGTQELTDRPNLLRLVLGEPAGEQHTDAGTHFVLEANIDDMSGELAARAVERIMTAGALDAWITPISMKKGRPGITLAALGDAAHRDAVARAMLSETTTLGLRVRPTARIERPRRSVEVQTPYGRVRVKVSDGDGLTPNVAPEYESCRQAAETAGVAVKQVYGAAIASYLARG